MSFLGGAECSTGSNPLAQFSKLNQQDTSLQRDRLVGRGPGGQESMRSQAGPGQEGMMDEFLQQPAQLPQGPASPWAMENMRHELQQMSNGNGSGAWASEFDPGLQHGIQSKSPGFNPAEFSRFQQAPGVQRTASPITNQQSNMPGYQPQMGMQYGGGMGMGMMGMQRSFSPMYQNQTPMQQQQQQQQPQQNTGKGKERMVELDDQNWEAQFAQLEQTDMTDVEANEAIERELNGIDRSVDPETAAQLHHSETDEFGDFESIWRGIQAETAAARSLVDDDAFLDSMNMNDMNDWSDFDGLNTHQREPSLGEYLYEEHNPFTDTANPYEEGLRIMNSGGNLSLAALAFEAAVQREPDHVAAWVRLGSAQAQNEKETPAIRALEQAIQIDPNNLEALMGLAVSYTNESYETTAYRTLERWLATKYPDLITEPLDEPKEIGITSRVALHEKVTNLFIRAAQLSPSGETMDPDVQVGLGVLFYSADEFDKAVDCFEAALASTENGVVNNEQNLHLLWNRLGATLANSGRSEEAIQAYERALELRPNFVRARYNLGVSCININVLPEAAGHLLGALTMHKVTEREGRDKAREIVDGGAGGGSVSEGELERLLTQNQSTNLYDTLRRVFTNMGRRDLTDLVGPGMDPESFRGEFDF
ncbi:peroxisomal targeting signal receptor [Tothia fuscella]|uniref:Peroxisomal targeting signal receptor n=1 Tax=Tothia fuscella TaxID=1048955 RepID=A0A9P4P4P6_9PEZI|nr:peroxisomal targeting signal receptor [Tothia fuscella]